VDRAWRVTILYRMADIDVQSLDWRQALRIFEQIRTLQPDEEKARLKLVELNFRLGQEAQGLAELDNFIAYLASAGQKERAIAFMETMLSEGLERPSVRRRLAELYRQVGRAGGRHSARCRWRSVDAVRRPGWCSSGCRRDSGA
jgi:predicted Zn-dependent protease